MNLLDHRFKYAGAILVLCGIILSVLYLWLDLILRLPVFAIVSSFLETHLFSMSQTNIVDELMLILLLAGLFLMAFSKEKEEHPDFIQLRFKAWMKAFQLNTVLLLLSVVFIFGTGFIAILAINLYSMVVFYLAFFHFYLCRERRSAGKNGQE